MSQISNLTGKGGSTGNGIQTINSNAPDIAGNYVMAVTAGFTITQTPNTSTIGSRTGSFIIVPVAGTSQTAAAGTAYILSNPSLTTVALPSNASTLVGDVFRIIGLSGGYDISQAANQQIIIGAESSTLGVLGGVSCSGSIFNAIELTCVSNAGGIYIWAAVIPPQGTFTAT